MKIYIFADMEGISGICGSQFVLSDGSSYMIGRKYLTADVNVCAKACFEAGATEVIVRDGHGGNNHIIWDELVSGVKLVQGTTPRKRFFALEGSDGLILLGYHAMAGTRNAHLEHTFSSKMIQNLWMNGNRVGEFAVDAAIAGDYGVPVIMTSGCDKLCREAADFLPSVITCQVKISISQQGALLLPQEEAHALIREKTLQAMSKLEQGKMAPVKLSPVTFRTEYVERCEPTFGLVADRITEVSAETTEKAFYLRQ